MLPQAEKEAVAGRGAADLFVGAACGGAGHFDRVETARWHRGHRADGAGAGTYAAARLQ